MKILNSFDKCGSNWSDMASSKILEKAISTLTGLKLGASNLLDFLYIGVTSACFSGSGKMLSTNMRLVIVKIGLLMMETTDLIHLLVTLSYPGALPVGSLSIMSVMFFSVIVPKLKGPSSMSVMCLSIISKLKKHI